MNKIKACLGSLALGTTFLISGVTYASGIPDTGIVFNIDNPKMIVNGQQKEIDPGKGTAPVIRNSSTLMPIRSIIEEMGGTADWDAASSKVTIKLDGKTVELWIGKTTANVNGAGKALQVSPSIINGRTMLPIRFISENLGLSVNWYGDTKTVTISSSNDYAALVGGIIVTKPEFTLALSDEKYSMLQDAGISQSGSASYFEKESSDGKTNLEIAKEFALDNLKKFKVQLAKAKENGVKFTAEEEKDMSRKLETFINSQGGKDQADNYMKTQYGISLADYNLYFRDMSLVKKFFQIQADKLSDSDPDVQKYYQANKDSFEQVTVKHILLMTVDQGTRQPLSQDKQDAAKKLAEDVLSQVKAGGNFDELAKKYSEDPGSKDSGGEYTFGKGKMVKEFEDWSFSAKEGDIGIVKSSYGYHVMKFVKKFTEADALKQVKNMIFQSKYDNIISDWAKDPKYNIIKNDSVFDSIK